MTPLTKFRAAFSYMNTEIYKIDVIVFGKFIIKKEIAKMEILVTKVLYNPPTVPDSS